MWLLRYGVTRNESDCFNTNITIKANAFVPGWGNHIFQSASEMLQNTLIRERLNEILSKAPKEKEEWEARRATIQSEFLKELDEEKKTQVTKMSDDDAVLVEGGGPEDKSGTSKKKATNK